LGGTSSLLGAEVLFTALPQVNTCHNCPTTRFTLPPYAPLTYKLSRHTVSAPYCATKNDLSIAHLNRLQSHHRKTTTRRIQTHKASFAQKTGLVSPFIAWSEQALIRLHIARSARRRKTSAGIRQTRAVSTMAAPSLPQFLRQSKSGGYIKRKQRLWSFR
jgi:hypothetical protein